MYEVFNINTDEVYTRFTSYRLAWRWIDSQDKPEDWDVRVNL